MHLPVRSTCSPLFDDFISKGRVEGHGGDGRNHFEVSQSVLYRDPLDLVFRG